MPLESFVAVPAGSDFPLENLPWGVFRCRGPKDKGARIGVALGSMVVDVAALHERSLLSGPHLSTHGGASLLQVSRGAVC